MALVANYGTDSESDDDVNEPFENKGLNNKNLLTAGDESDDSEPEITQNKIETENNHHSERLPLPTFMNENETRILNSSVFSNPFKDAEHEKFSILEKHVKMTHTNVEDLNKKKICHSFRKGRCRFGNKCKFEHASKSVQPIPENQNTAVLNSEINYEYDYQDDEESESVEKRKRKAGLSRTLIPSKKAMKDYKKTQVEERPWTMSS
ncbi:uncharacterized protein [Antedon mediterranea]|uniref:uncharacterized protein n=1 Tax=Antedon mediterranea TaxID=105859 RepID=UPI003AF46FA0